MTNLAMSICLMIKNNVFQITFRVYYEDTDAGGVVYHSNYLNFMERARSEWLRNLGYEQDVLIEQEQLLFAVKQLDINYIQPARFNDLLLINSTVDSLSGTRINFKQQIMKQEQLLCEANVTVVSLDSVSLKPKRITQKIKEDLTRVHNL